MKVDNIRKVKNAIEGGLAIRELESNDISGEAFNMNVFAVPECNSPGCITGYAAAFAYPEKFKLQYLSDTNINLMDIYKVVENYFGISPGAVDELCTPMYSYANIDSVNPEDPAYISEYRAAAVLDNLIKTGEVDWTIRGEG